MATTIGTESDPTDLVQNLIHLEHDAIAAYESCIERLDDAAAKTQVSAFLQDHRRHLDELHQIASMNGIEAPSGGSMKQMLTTGKVAFADMMGDGAILKAMKTNEDDTVAAYERASTHESCTPQARSIFQRAHEDELRHRAYMENASGRV